MTNDNALAEYRSLYVTLIDLGKRFIEKRQEVFKLLQENALQKRKAFSVLNSAKRLDRYLTVRQRHMAGIAFCAKALPVMAQDKKLPEIRLPELEANCQNASEAREKSLLLLALIDDIKKMLLQLELLEHRCREQIISVKKALAAFRHELGNTKQKLFPFGVFSFLRRFCRRFFGRTFFTFRDFDDIAALGKLSALVLKIADSPLI